MISSPIRNIGISALFRSFNVIPLTTRKVRIASDVVFPYGL